MPLHVDVVLNHRQGVQTNNGPEQDFNSQDESLFPLKTR
jgi:hypothetical protein